MFGNSDAVRQGSYVHDMPEEDYTALGGLSASAVSPDEPDKKSPLDSPFSGGISGIFAYLKELGDRRLTYYDLCKMLCEERGVDLELFNRVAEANPVVGEMASFITPLTEEAYAETPRKVSWLYRV